MKYKVGDKVRVRKDLIEGQFHGGAVFYREMSPLLGSIVTISHVFTGVNRYHLLEHHTGEYWTDEMLEDVEEDKLEDVKFEAGKWYKGEANNYYFKAAESLLAEAKKRYPVGTRFISVNDKLLYTVKTDSHRWCNDGIDVEGIPWVYLNGRWAEIVESPTNQQKITPNGLTPIWVYPIAFESSKNKGESVTHLVTCETCNGTGTVMVPKLYPSGHTEVNEDCPDCGGLGEFESDYDEEPLSENSGRFSFTELISNKPPFSFKESSANESDFPIISTKRIINFSQLT